MNKRKIVLLLSSLIVTVVSVVSGAMVLFGDPLPTPKKVEAANHTDLLYTADGTYNSTVYPVLGDNYKFPFDDGSLYTCVELDINSASRVNTNAGGPNATFMRVDSVGDGYYAYDAFDTGNNYDYYGIGDPTLTPNTHKYHKNNASSLTYYTASDWYREAISALWINIPASFSSSNMHTMYYNSDAPGAGSAASDSRFVANIGYNRTTYDTIYVSKYENISTAKETLTSGSVIRVGNTAVEDNKSYHVDGSGTATTGNGNVQAIAESLWTGGAFANSTVAGSNLADATNVYNINNVPSTGNYNIGVLRKPEWVASQVFYKNDTNKDVPNGDTSGTNYWAIVDTGANYLYAKSGTVDSSLGASDYMWLPSYQQVVRWAGSSGPGVVQGRIGTGETWLRGTRNAGTPGSAPSVDYWTGSALGQATTAGTAGDAGSLWEKRGVRPCITMKLPERRYAVTLSDGAGSGGSGTIYITKPKTGWTPDANATMYSTSDLTDTTSTVTSVVVPTRSGYTFDGYYDSAGTQCISSGGIIQGGAWRTNGDGTGAGITLTASWSQNTMSGSASSDGGGAVVTVASSAGYHDIAINPEDGYRVDYVTFTNVTEMTGTTGWPASYNTSGGGNWPQHDGSITGLRARADRYSGSIVTAHFVKIVKPTGAVTGSTAEWNGGGTISFSDDGPADVTFTPNAGYHLTGANATTTAATGLRAYSGAASNSNDAPVTASYTPGVEGTTMTATFAINTVSGSETDSEDDGVGRTNATPSTTAEDKAKGTYKITVSPEDGYYVSGVWISSGIARFGSGAYGTTANVFNVVTDGVKISPANGNQNSGPFTVYCTPSTDGVTISASFALYGQPEGSPRIFDASRVQRYENDGGTASVVRVDSGGGYGYRITLDPDDGYHIAGAYESLDFPGIFVGTKAYNGTTETTNTLDVAASINDSPSLSGTYIPSYQSTSIRAAFAKNSLSVSNMSPIGYGNVGFTGGSTLTDGDYTITANPNAWYHVDRMVLVSSGNARFRHTGGSATGVTVDTAESTVLNDDQAIYDQATYSKTIAFSKPKDAADTSGFVGSVVVKCTPSFDNTTIHVYFALNPRYAITFETGLSETKDGTQGTSLAYLHYQDSQLYTSETEGASALLNGNGKLTPPTRSGYTFKGYYNGSEGTGTRYIDESGLVVDYTIKANTTLYAKWNKNKLTVQPYIDTSANVKDAITSLDTEAIGGWGVSFWDVLPGEDGPAPTTAREGRNFYSVRVNPVDGYKVNYIALTSASPAGITTANDGVPFPPDWGVKDKDAFPKNDDEDITLQVIANSETESVLYVYFTLIVKPTGKVVGDNGTISIADNTGPSWTLELDPKPGYHLSKVTASLADGIAWTWTVRPYTDTAATLHDNLITTHYTPAVDGTVITAEFEKNTLAERTLNNAHANGTVLVEDDGDSPEPWGKYKITATPNPGYRVTQVDILTSAGAVGGNGRFSLYSDPTDTDMVKHVNPQNYATVGSLKQEVIYILCIPEYTEQQIYITFTPNTITNVVYTVYDYNGDIYKDDSTATNIAGSHVLEPAVGDPITEPRYKITAIPNDGYRVAKIEMQAHATQGTVTSDLDPDGGGLPRDPNSVVYDGDLMGVRVAADIIKFIRSNTTGATVIITFMRNVIDVPATGMMKEFKDGSDIGDIAYVRSQYGSAGIGQGANIFLEPSGVADTETGARRYRVKVTPPAGYRVTRIYLSDGAEGLADYAVGATQDAVTIESFYSNTEAVTLHVEIARNITTIYGTEVTEFDSNFYRPEEYKINGTVTATPEAPIGGQTSGTYTVYEYPYGYVYWADTNTRIATDGLLVYDTYVEPKPGFRVGTQTIGIYFSEGAMGVGTPDAYAPPDAPAPRRDAKGWMNNLNTYDAYYTPNPDGSEGTRVYRRSHETFKDVFIPYADGYYLCVIFVHNEATIGQAQLTSAPDGTADRDEITGVSNGGKPEEVNGLVHTVKEEGAQGKILGTVTMHWNALKAQYHITIHAEAGYRVGKVIYDAGATPLGKQSSFKRSDVTFPKGGRPEDKDAGVNNGDYLINNGWSGYDVYIVMIPNADGMEVLVDFYANYAVLDTTKWNPAEGEMELKMVTGVNQPAVGTASENNAKTAAPPFYSLTATPKDGYVVDHFESNDRLCFLNNAQNKEDLFLSDHRNDRAAVTVYFVALKNGVKVWAVFRKTDIWLADAEGLPQQPAQGTKLELNEGTISWTYDQMRKIYSVTVTPYPGWRVTTDGIVMTTYKWGWETDGEEQNTYNQFTTLDRTTYIQYSRISGSAGYSDSSARVMVEFDPLWDNVVISVSFEWNEVLAEDVQITNNNVGGKVNIGERSLAAGAAYVDRGTQIITVTPAYGYRISEITMKTGDEFTDGIYLEEEFLEEVTEKTVTVVDGVNVNAVNVTVPSLSGYNVNNYNRLKEINPGSNFHNYSHVFIFYVRPYYNNPIITVSFVTNAAAVASVDETIGNSWNSATKISNSDNTPATENGHGSIFGTVKMDIAPTWYVNSGAASDGLYYKATAKPNAGYKFSGWAVYYTDPGPSDTGPKMHYEEGIRALGLEGNEDARDDMITIEQINNTLTDGVPNTHWVSLPTDDEDTGGAIMDQGKFRNITWFADTETVYRRTNDMTIYGGHLATEDETENGDWSERTKLQTVYFTPQYNGMTLVAMFEILTPTIFVGTAPVASYPIYDGEEHELLMSPGSSTGYAKTQSWAEIQYGYAWDADAINGATDNGTEIPENVARNGAGEIAWSTTMPARTDVIYSANDIGKVINGHLVGDTDIGYDGDNAVMIETIYYRAIHIQGTLGSNRSETERPTLFVSQAEDDEPYDDIDGNSTVTTNVPDVRILPLPISYYFLDAEGQPAYIIDAADEEKNNITKIEELYDDGARTDTLLNLHDGFDNDEDARRDWMEDYVLIDTKPGRQSRMPLTSVTDDPPTFAERGWDARRSTNVILGMVLYETKMEKDYNDSLEDTDPDNDTAFLVNPKKNGGTVASVFYDKFTVTGYWFAYTGNEPVNGMTAKGNYMATGNFTGYLHQVDSFDITDRAASIKWRSFREAGGDNRDEFMVTGNPMERVQAVGVTKFDSPIRVMPMQLGSSYYRGNAVPYRAGIHERTRKYEYTFLGWSKTPQDWTGKEDEVSAGELEGTYLTDADWGLDEDGNMDEDNNTQIPRFETDREIVYHAIYSRTLRVYTLNFSFYAAGVVRTDLDPITKYYGQRFYQSDVLDANGNPKGMLKGQPITIPTDVNNPNSNERYVFKQWWNIDESYWRDDNDGKGKYMIIEGSWTFDSIPYYERLIMIEGETQY